MVDWIIMNPSNPNDLVAQSINPTDPVFLTHFTMVIQEPSGLSLFHQNGLPPLPTRLVPKSLLTAHNLCDASLYGQSGNVGTGSSSGTTNGDTSIKRVWSREGWV
jgi:hypothetical protein